MDGAANDALISFLAESLGVPRLAVSIVGGKMSRTNLVAIAGVDENVVAHLGDAR